MVSIEAWRSSIGRHHNVKLSNLNKASKLHNARSKASFALSTLLATVLCSALIGTLLRIGCVETNPGPTENYEGKFISHFIININEIAKNKSISLLNIMDDNNFETLFY